MTRVLAVIRRLFLGGVVALLCAGLLPSIGFTTVLNNALNHSTFSEWYCVFLILSPLFYILFTIISVFYIRSHGQFAMVHKKKSFITLFFKALGSDCASPFKNIKNFFLALFSKNVYGRGRIIGRFFELLFIVAFLITGLYTLIR